MTAPWKVAEVMGAGRDETQGQFPFVYAATVTKATPTELQFTLDDEDARFEFPPAPYQRPPDLTTGQPSTGAAHTHTIDQTPENVPPRGTAIAVAFAAGDPDRPLVLAIYGWPE